MDRARVQEDAEMERQAAIESKRAKLADKLAKEESQYQQDIFEQQVCMV